VCFRIPQTRQSTIFVAYYVHWIALVALKAVPDREANPNKFNIFRLLASLACKLQLKRCLLPEASLGCHVTTLFGNTAVIAIAAPKKKYSLLPVLTVLFVISYGLMTMLIVEQGSVIQAQRNLIKILLPESAELWGMKGKAISDKQMAKARAQNSAQAPSTQAQTPAHTPSSQTPSTQAPATQTPSTQRIPQQQHAPSRPGRIAKPGIQAPPVPAADLVDHRRALLTI
jgi:hypothetical protein